MNACVCRNLINFMKNILLVLSILFLGCNTEPTLLDIYKKEITTLKTEDQIEDYWNKLLKLDQEALKTGKYSTKEHDSLNITHMMRTALMFEIHGAKFYNFDNVVPEMHFTHNYFGESKIAFWPLIKKCVNVRGDIKLLQYPEYQLEGVTNTFYDYSIYSDKNKHEFLLNKLNVLESTSVSNDLFEALNYQTSLLELKDSAIIGKWQRQQIKGLNENDFFEFVKMSDNLIYYRKNQRIQKLELIKIIENTKFYRVEKEPFGWSFKLEENRDLSLIDENEVVLINYSKFNYN